MNVLANLPESLIAEAGGDFGFVCIWRPGSSGDCSQRMTVGEFLSKPENQSGTWLIDGGWGGPPGPIHVRWTGSAWESGGFCGRAFETAVTRGVSEEPPISFVIANAQHSTLMSISADGKVEFPGAMADDERAKEIAAAIGQVWAPNAELAAARLRITALEAGVLTAADKFDEYAALHAAKPDMEKAARNKLLADQLRTLLSAQV